MQTGLYDDAISAWSKFIALSPGSSKIHFNLGLAYANKDMFSEAIAAFKKALSIDPENIQTLYHLADAYDKSGLIDDAFHEYNIAAKLISKAKNKKNNASADKQNNSEEIVVTFGEK